MQVTIEQALQLAIQHHHAGRLAEAEKIYRQILARQPNHPDALNLLGVLASQVGRHDDAIELIRRSLILRPDYVSALVNLGNILCIQGKFDEAAFTCRRAIDLNPSDAVALNNLGIALLGQGKADESAIAYRRAIQLQPGYPEAFNNLGNALKHQGQLDEAIVAYRQAIELKPNYVDAWINLGNAHKDLGQFEEAANAYRQAIQHDPRFAEAYSNLAIALSGQGKIGDAIAACRQAIEVKPARAESHWNLGVLLLLSGDFEAGWKEYESRLLCMQFNTPANRFSQPAWHGQSLQGYTILLHAEQGFGDAIQFLRYVSMLVPLGARIILECQSELYALFKDYPGIAQAITRGQDLPAFDFHSPLLSLPLAFGTTLQSIPKSIPYLTADPHRVEAWRDLLPETSGESLKIGLAWAGIATHTNDKNRSLDLRQLSPLARVKGVQFNSLQKGPAASQVVALDVGITVFDFSDKLTDFAETAALIANMDLVITVDTAVAHLAGAMGKPVWVLLPFVPDWRWMMDREDSPWYPTMRLFRQKSIGQWDEVIVRVTECLENFVTPASSP